MEDRFTHWIEVEPGAPLPAEALPGAECHDRVERRELSGAARRAAVIAGAAILAGVACVVLFGEWRGLAGLPLGLALVGAGLIGGARKTEYLPAPEGRYVLAEAAVLMPAEQERKRRANARLERIWDYAAKPLMTAMFAATLISDGVRPAQVILSALALFCAISTPEWIRSWKNRSESEAVASERFRQFSDPRVPLPADTLVPSRSESTGSPSSPDPAPSRPG